MLPFFVLCNLFARVNSSAVDLAFSFTFFVRLYKLNSGSDIYETTTYTQSSEQYENVIIAINIFRLSRYLIVYVSLAWIITEALEPPLRLSCTCTHSAGTETSKSYPEFLPISRLSTLHHKILDIVLGSVAFSNVANTVATKTWDACVFCTNIEICLFPCT